MSPLVKVNPAAEFPQGFVARSCCTGAQLTERSIQAAFQTLPASGFVVNGAAQARDAALVSAGAEMKWRNGFSLAATFDGELSRNVESYAGKGTVRYQW